MPKSFEERFMVKLPPSSTLRKRLHALQQMLAGPRLHAYRITLKLHGCELKDKALSCDRECVKL
jgi:hypothetical protein